MTNDQIFAQHETLTSMVRSLVVRVDAVDARLLGDIMTELVDSFGLAPPVWAAAPAWQLLQTLMRGEGQEERSWQDQAADFNTQEVLMFLNALWDVYEATARAYFGASSSSTRASGESAATSFVWELFLKRQREAREARRGLWGTT